MTVRVTFSGLCDFPLSTFLALGPAAELGVAPGRLSLSRRRDASEHRGRIDWFSAVWAVHSYKILFSRLRHGYFEQTGHTKRSSARTPCAWCS